MDEFIKVYDTLVPNIYVPEPALMREIVEMLEVIEKEKAIELLPRIISQVQMFDMLDRIQIMKLLFNLMTGHCAPADVNSPLNEQYAKMADTLWNHIEVSSYCFLKKKKIINKNLPTSCIVAFLFLIYDLRVVLVDIYSRIRQ